MIDKIGDLSWIGSDYAGLGWVEAGDAPPGPVTSTEAELAWERAKQLLRESDWSMLPDVPMTSGEKSEWIEYRKALREIKLQPGFPNDIKWPKGPY